MNIVLFGAGAIAREHVRAIRRLQALPQHVDLHLRGVYAPRPGRAAAFATDLELSHSTTDPRTYLDDPTIDVVIVCSPSAMHAAQTEAALAAGKHVLCEIPIALSLVEAITLRDVAERQQRTLMIAHTNRFRPSFRAVRDQIADGRLHPTAVISRYLFLRRANVGWTGYQRSWTDNLLWHHGGHAVDLCLWMLGASQVEVVGQIAPPHPDLKAPLDLSLIAQAPDGALATIAMSYNSAVSVHDYLVIGQETTLQATPDNLLAASGEPVPGLDLTIDPIVAQNDAFFTAIRTGQPAPIDVNAILPSLSALQQVASAAGLGLSAEEDRQSSADRDSLLA